MLINVDVNSLIARGTSADIYVLLQLINDKQLDLASNYLKIFNYEDKKRLFQKLNESQFCTNINNIDEYDPSKIIILPDFSEFLIMGDFFDELVKVFPVSVVRTDGTKDFLRTDLKRTKSVYSRLTKNKLNIHRHIIDCLKFEIETRKKNGSMGWFKRLPNWVVSEEWKVYEDAMKEQVFQKDEDLGYGTQLE